MGYVGRGSVPPESAKVGCDSHGGPRCGLKTDSKEFSGATCPPLTCLEPVVEIAIRSIQGCRIPPVICSLAKVAARAASSSELREAAKKMPVPITDLLAFRQESSLGVQHAL